MRGKARMMLCWKEIIQAQAFSCAAGWATECLSGGPVFVQQERKNIIHRLESRPGKLVGGGSFVEPDGRW